MNIRRCENDHFYNGDRYKVCPYCEEAKLLQNPDTEKQENAKKGKNRQEERTEGSSSQEKICGEGYPAGLSESHRAVDRAEHIDYNNGECDCRTNRIADHGYGGCICDF